MWFSRDWMSGQTEALAFPKALVIALAKKPKLVRDLNGLPAMPGRSGTLEVRLATTRKEIKTAQRLRYKVFFEEGGATPDAAAALTRRDICPFDHLCDHLLVFDHAARTPRLGRLKPKVVGTYRLLRQDVAARNGGFYSAREFDIAPLLARHPGLRFLELGRSCVLASHRSKKTLALLWRGLWAYVQHHRIDVMMGCASFPGANPLAHALPLRFLAGEAAAPPQWNARAHPRRRVAMSGPAEAKTDARKALAALPPLIKGYLRVGARFGDGAVVDRQFGTTDVFVVMPVAGIAARYAAHFGDGGAREAA